jgi:hypothetical protein
MLTFAGSEGEQDYGDVGDLLNRNAFGSKPKRRHRSRSGNLSASSNASLNAFTSHAESKYLERHPPTSEVF